MLVYRIGVGKHRGPEDPRRRWELVQSRLIKALIIRGLHRQDVRFPSVVRQVFGKLQRSQRADGLRREGNDTQ